MQYTQIPKLKSVRLKRKPKRVRLTRNKNVRRRLPAAGPAVWYSGILVFRYSDHILITLLSHSCRTPIALLSTRFFSDSSQIPFRFLSDSFQIPFRFLSNSFRFLSDSSQIPLRFLSDSSQIPFRFLSESFQIPFRLLSGAPKTAQDGPRCAKT